MRLRTLPSPKIALIWASVLLFTATVPELSALQSTDAGEAAADSLSDVPNLRFGGAVRLNYAWRDYDAGLKDRFGDFAFELFRIDVNGEFNDLLLSVQYRWYETFEAVHHAYFGYKPGDRSEVRLGISRIGIRTQQPVS